MKQYRKNGKLYIITVCKNCGNILYRRKDRLNSKTCKRCKPTKHNINEYSIKDNIVRLKVINNKGEIYNSIFDRKYLNEVKKYKWYIDSGGYLKTKAFRLHQLIAKLEYGEYDKNYVVDHINRNKSDNRSCNLRVVTELINLLNKDNQSNNTSGVKGVSFNKRDNNWSAYFQLNGKRTIKSFKTFEEAVKYRKHLENLYFKEE